MNHQSLRSSTPAGGFGPTTIQAARQDFRHREDQRRAAAYAEFLGPVTAQFTDAILDCVGDPARRGGDLVVDVGCGDGSLAVALRARGWRPVPVDRSVAMARLAARAVGTAVVADALHLPLPTASAAAVVSAFLVPHLPDLRAGLGELRRVLRPGGRLVLATWEEAQLSPFTGLAASVVRALAPDRTTVLREREQRASAQELTGVCEQVGLPVLAVEPVTVMAALPSVHHWWTGLLSASCGLGVLLSTLPAEVRQAARAMFEAEAAGYRMDDGSVLVPASAVVIMGETG